jgi:uncharacterized SAM-binding protein YcdF (DUF218 family)
MKGLPCGGQISFYDGLEMLVDRTPTTQNAEPARRRRARSLVRAFGGLVATGLVAAAIGFVWFLWRVPAAETVLDRDADGIVVLTGGSPRIGDALDLLAAGRGKRLLITGVHVTTTARELARGIPAHEALLACCVDIDHSAVNTVGNAMEARRWVQARGFRSLIVVTSDYHMPRAMAELGQQLPDVELTSFPVITDKLRRRWWMSPAAARLIVSEYVKFIVAQLRITLGPVAAATAATNRNGLI